VRPCVWMFIFFCTLMMCHGYYNNLSCGVFRNYAKLGFEEKSLGSFWESSVGRPTSGQSHVVGVVPDVPWKTCVRTIGIRVEIRSRGRQKSANHYTSTEAWLGRSLHKRTPHYIITRHSKASRPLPDVIGSSYGTGW
jgi:hypothetical protein